MKKMNLKAAVVLAAMVVVLMMTALPVSAAIAKGDSRVTSANLNMRSKPSTSGSVVAVVPKGKFVKITAVSSNNWYKISYSSKAGYVSGQYLKSPFDLFGNKYSKYVATAIWMRTSPKQTSSNKIRVIPTGGKVFVIAKVANVNWYKVYFGGKVGYIMGGYFKGDTTNSRVLAKNVYLRSSPVVSTGNRICVVPKGATVILISKYNSKWYKVRYGTKVGYLAAGYFTTDQKTTSTTKTMKTAINMRSSMSTTADNIIAVIPEGAKVTVVASYSGNWVKVKYDGKTGYIKAGYFV
jgi:N-acetylmuramoyl-L-alanine amidase